VSFTVYVKLPEVPVQVTPEMVTEGVTVTVAIAGLLVLLRAVKEPILPVPVAASPMDGLLLLQVKTVLGTLPENVTAVVLLPLHNIWLDTEATFGVGFTEEV